MKKYFLSAIAIGFAMILFAQPASFTKKADGIIVYPADKNIKAVELKVVSNNIIKVLTAANKAIKPDTSFMIAAPAFI